MSFIKVLQSYSILKIIKQYIIVGNFLDFNSGIKIHGM
jgi:hypothetical protein